MEEQLLIACSKLTLLFVYLRSFLHLKTLGFDQQGMLKLYNFVLARRFNVKSSSSSTAFAGTYPNASPEAVLYKEFDMSMDVYAMGMVVPVGNLGAERTLWQYYDSGIPIVSARGRSLSKNGKGGMVTNLGLHY